MDTNCKAIVWFPLVPCQSPERKGLVASRTEFEAGVWFYFGFQSANTNVNQRQKNGQGFLFIVCL